MQERGIAVQRGGIAFAFVACVFGLAACQPASTPAPAPGAVPTSAASAQPKSASTPPLDHAALVAAARAATAKANPAYARFSVDVVTGDIDGDGRDDAVVQYPTGAEDTDHPIGRETRIFLDRPDGLVSLPQEDMPDFCAVVRGIAAHVVRFDALDACAIPFPALTGIYRYAWNGKTIVEQGHVTPQVFAQERLAALADALERNDRDAVLGFMDFPIEASALQVYDTPLAAEADRHGGQVSRALAEAHFDDLFAPDRRKEWIAVMRAVQGGKWESSDSGMAGLVSHGTVDGVQVDYSLGMDMSPERPTEPIAGGGEAPVDARVWLIWGAPSADADEVVRPDAPAGSVAFVLYEGRLRLRSIGFAN